MYLSRNLGSYGALFFKTPYVTQTSGLCEDTFSQLDKEEIEMRSWKVFKNKSLNKILRLLS